MDKTSAWLLDKITKHPLNTWTGFKRIMPYGILLTLIFDKFIFLPILDDYLGVSQNLIIIIFFSTFSILVFYVLYFFIQRILIIISVSFSKKINIVLAYNLESVLVLNTEKFQKKYKSLEINLKKYIRIYELENSISVIVAPADVKLSNSSAEAKTKLGLLGSTLLVWGDLVLQNKTYFFRTRFSYEFGYKKNISLVKARENVSKYIESFTNKRLYPSVRNRLSSFEENLLLTCLFILGFSTFSVRDYKKSIFLFETFRKSLKESNIITQYDFSSLNNEVKGLLVQMYINEINYFYGLKSIIKNIVVIKEIANKIIEIDLYNYQCNIVLAFVSEIEGNRSLALKYNKVAEMNIPINNYAHLFNQAYFSLIDENFTKTIEIYKSIPVGNQNLNLSTSEVSNFMNEKFFTTGKLEFLFADGYICYMWDDKNRGKKMLKSFTEKAKSNNFVILVNEANNILTE